MRHRRQERGGAQNLYRKLRDEIGCIRCGAAPAYPGAVYCGAACCALWEAGDRDA